MNLNIDVWLTYIILIIYVTYIKPKMEYNSHLWAGASKTALDFVDRGACSITSLGHRRNIRCILFYKYYFGKRSSGLSELLPPPQVLGRNTRLSGRSHEAFTVATMSHRTTHYRENSFFTRTARLWNDLPANIFTECFNISMFKTRVNQHFLLSPPSI